MCQVGTKARCLITMWTPVAPETYQHQWKIDSTQSSPFVCLESPSHSFSKVSWDRLDPGGDMHFSYNVFNVLECLGGREFDGRQSIRAQGFGEPLPSISTITYWKDGLILTQDPVIFEQPCQLLTSHWHNVEIVTHILECRDVLIHETLLKL